MLGLGLVTSLLLALQWGGNTKAWSDPTIIALLVVFGVVTAIFLFWERTKGSRAMVPLAMLSRYTLLGCVIAGVSPMNLINVSRCMDSNIEQFFEYLALLLATVSLMLQYLRGELTVVTVLSSFMVRRQISDSRKRYLNVISRRYQARGHTATRSGLDMLPFLLSVVVGASLTAFDTDRPI